MDEVVRVMLKVTDYVMRFAPFGVFGAVAGAITTQGLGMLLVFGKFMLSFYIALAVLWAGAHRRRLPGARQDIFRLLKLVRGPMLVGFSTASSESVYPKLMEQLEKFGIKTRVTGFVPWATPFNLDGSMMLPPSPRCSSPGPTTSDDLTAQVTMLLVLMVSSKGHRRRAALLAGRRRRRAAHVRPAGSRPAAGARHRPLPRHGRTVTNVLGNAIATSVVAKWENAIDPVPDELAGRRRPCRCRRSDQRRPAGLMGRWDCLLRVRHQPSDVEPIPRPVLPAPGFFLILLPP